MIVTLSCDKSIESYMLDARLEMVTSVVDDGGSMSFKVFCNEDSFTVRNLSCEFSDAGVITNDNTYQVSNGFAQFTFSGVSVSEDHNSVVKFNVCGKDGSVIPVSGMYYCQTFRPEMTVSPVSVTTGGHLMVTVKSNHPSFTLMSLTSSATIADAPPAGVYPSGQVFDIRVTQPSGKTSSTYTISAIVYDDYLKCEKTLQGEFMVY